MGFLRLGVWLMKEPIVVVNANEEESIQLFEALESESYKIITMNSLFNLEEKIQETACGMVILDLDGLPVDDRFFMSLRKKFPALPIIGLSERTYHPELKEALSSHICVCLVKPTDIEELIYCIRSFCE